MRRCCECKRTFGPAPGIPAGEFTDGYCETCWPIVVKQWGIAGGPYPGEMTEARADRPAVAA